MKKYTCRIFALLLVVLFLPSLSFSAHGWSQENGWIIERRKYEEQYNTIIEYTGKEAFALVPERVAGLIVTAIGPYAFTKNTYVTSVMVSDTVSVAGTNAFAGCPNLQKVKFLGETQWHRALFKDCIKLESVNFPANVHTIPEEAFSNCTSLASLTIPESVWVIEPKAFAGCTGLREIQFMDYVQIQPNSFTGVTATVLYCSAQ